MSYDLNVLVIQQETPTILPFPSSIQVINEMEQQLRYFDKWSYMVQTKGSWYCLGQGDEDLFNALSIVEADFDAHTDSLMIPNWVNNKDKLSNFVPMIVLLEYTEEFVKIVKHLINLSPIKTIMFLARFQSYDTEIVYGVLGFNEFWDLHNKGRILFNVCYIIRADETDSHCKKK